MKRPVVRLLTLILAAALLLTLAAFATSAMAIERYYGGYARVGGFGVKATAFTPSSQPNLAYNTFTLNQVTAVEGSNACWVQCGWVCRKEGSTIKPCQSYVEINDPPNNYYYKYYRPTTLGWDTGHTYECVWIGNSGSNTMWRTIVDGSTMTLNTLAISTSTDTLDLVGELPNTTNQGRAKYTNGMYKNSSGAYVPFSGSQVLTGPWTWSGTPYPYQFIARANY